MLKIHLLLKKEDIDRQKMRENKVAVVFDVLLATSTVASALEFGAKEVIPVLDGTEARQEATGREDGSFVLVGEYQGVTIDGFLSPNPLELKHLVQGKTVILSTTNGTIALKNSSMAGAVYAASLLNSRAVVNHILQDSEAKTIILVCSGSSNQFNVEDFYGAGYFIDCLTDLHRDKIEMTDSAFASHLFYKSNKDNAAYILSCSRVGKMLSKYGFDKEIEFAAQKSLFDVVPFLCDGKRIVTI
ncbi:2-phosphosulfolactate phosphatase [Bacillus sp. T33-2]|uniref:2-phosphosulfolactate phosphatase n=1 Tax=Bacillus sp. T33-2 TaxID=2054168 RepID=UPI000C77C3E6|nr:2-phosphosulfolactate phosphatase [Bacillus sp. T33-2]PLR95298.1 2-phosphosulfolactate phosphatase [Bacillus sp. T33-2]